jgi:two-component system sensor histidine kinase KdpD
MLRSFPGQLVAFRTGIFYRRYAFLLQCILGVLLALLLARAGLALGLDLSILSLLFLLLTVLFAARCGFWQASVFTVSGILCLTYFSAPPAFLRHIAAPRNGFAILIFEVTALVVSRVSARERAYAAESEIQRHRTQRLHAVSHNVLLLNLQDSPERQIAEFIHQEFEFDAVAIVSDRPGSVGAAGLWATNEEDLIEEKLRALASSRQETRGVSNRALLSTKGQIGSLLILGDIPPVVLDSLASLAALALERHRAFINEGAANAARNTEQLRTTVLDGLAHAFKTPLTIIRAASSGLLEAGHLDEVQHQLTQMIDEQSERLDELTTRLLETARVEGEDMCLQLETVDVPALIHEVVQEFRAESPDPANSFTEYPTINICIEGMTSPLAADYEMIASTLKELLINAVKYSTVGSPITIALSESACELTLSVQSHGPVIRMEDRDRIFERFYRGLNHRHAAPGTGIGLSVARRVTEAHGGHIWVTSSEEVGTTFHLSLPTRGEALASTKG